MLSFTIAQQQLIEADWKKVSWKFQITDTQTPANTYYWSTKLIDDTPDWEFKIIPESFRGVKINRCKSEMGMIATLVECSFQIHNKDNTLDPLDFVDATGQISCELTDDVTTVSRSWNIVVTQCMSLKQRLYFTCVDYFRKYINGDYPNGGKISDLFKSDNVLNNDNVCMPEPFGIAYIPLRLITSGANDYYVIGPKQVLGGNVTYTIYGQKTPKAFSSNQDEYTNIDYTFSQSDLADNYSIDRKVFQSDIDNGGNANFPGSQFFDVPTCFMRSDRAYTQRDPAEAIALILADDHVAYDGTRYATPNSDLDVTEKTASSATYEDWGMEWTGAIWKIEPKEKILAKILEMCHSTIKPESGTGYLALSVLSKASQKTITQKDVIQGSFQRQLLTKEINDSGYVAFPDLGPESLNETDFATSTKWTTDHDCSITNGAATWTFGDGQPSFLVQAVADMATPGIGKRLYRLTYTVSGVTGAPAATVASTFSQPAAALVITNGLQQTVFSSTGSPYAEVGDFAIVATLVAGQSFTIDNLSLKLETPQDEMVQILTPCKEGGAMASPSNEVLELPFIRDSIMAQKIGILHFQRKFLRMAQIRFTSKSRLFANQPDDMITIDEDDYGGTYDVLVDTMFINKNLTIEMECTQFSDYLDDYDDLNPTAITKATVTPQAAIMASPARMFMADFTTTPVKSNRVLKHWSWCGDIVDDGIIILPTITTLGYGQISIINGTNVQVCIFTVSAVGTAQDWYDSSTLFVPNADTDTKFCLGTAAPQTPLQLKNRLGSTQSALVIFWYD